MRDLTDKQKAFCEEYVLNGFNASQAYVKAYGGTAKAGTGNSCLLLKSRKILNYIDDIEGQYKVQGYSIGVNKKRIMIKISEMLDAKKPVIYNGTIVAETPDYGAINNAITTYAKLTGDFAAEKKEVTITEDDEGLDISKMTEEERKEYKKEILRQLQV